MPSSSGSSAAWIVPKLCPSSCASTPPELTRIQALQYAWGPLAHVLTYATPPQPQPGVLLGMRYDLWV